MVLWLQPLLALPSPWAASAQMTREDIDWLRQCAGQAIAEASVEQPDPYHEGQTFVAVTPGGGYGRIYLADYVHACESRLVPAEEMSAALDYLVPHYAGNYLGSATGGWTASRREPGPSPLGPLRLLPKEGWTEENPQLLAKGVWLYWKLSGDLSVFQRHQQTIADYLLEHTGWYVKDNGLVWFDEADVMDDAFRKRGYGFYDTVQSTGYNLFASLLLWEAYTALREMYAAAGDLQKAEAFFARAQRIAAALVPTFYDEDSGLLLSATEANRQPDVWGSAYAVSLGVLDRRHADEIAEALARRVEESLSADPGEPSWPGIVWRGQVRHLADDRGWERCDTEVSSLGRYQNGAYWGTATGWLFQAVRRCSVSTAERMMAELIADCRQRGALECVHPEGDYTKGPGYVSTVTLPLAALIEEGYFPDQPPLLSLRPTVRPPSESRFGVNAHCYTLNEVRAMEDLEIGWFVKHLFTWHEVERERGQYAFPAERVRYLNELTARGIQIIHPLCYSSPFFPDGPAFPWGQLRKDPGGQVIPPFMSEDGRAPASSPDARWIRGFADFAYQTVRRFGSRGSGQIRYWSIWGEPNGYAGERADEIATPYVALARETASRVQEADPDAVIIGCCTSRIDFRFLSAALEQGIGESVDLISIHPYRETTFPEDAFRPERYGGPVGLKSYEEEIGYLQQMLVEAEAAAEPGRWRLRSNPLAITEIGWRGDEDHPVAVSATVQAKYLLRTLLLNLALGIDPICWYQLVGDGFGVAWADPQWDLHPRSGYEPMRRVARLFPGRAECVAAEALLSDEVQEQGGHAYLFATDAGYRLAAWLGVESGDEDRVVKADLRLPRQALDGAEPPQTALAVSLLSGEESSVRWEPEGDGWAIRDFPLSDAPSALVW